jgi:FkbM family methyltransferase
VISPVALSHENGKRRFATFNYPGVSHIARPDSPADARMVEVETRTLDDLVYTDDHPAPDFIKIDVEGGELDVLLGARRVLSEAGPVVVCEARKGELWENLTALMHEHGYEARILHETAFLGDIAFVRTSRP